MSERRRADVGPISERRRNDVGAASARCRSDVGPTSIDILHRRIAPLSLDRTAYIWRIYACVTRCCVIADDDVPMIMSQSHDYAVCSAVHISSDLHYATLHTI